MLTYVTTYVVVGGDPWSLRIIIVIHSGSHGKQFGLPRST